MASLAAKINIGCVNDSGWHFIKYLAPALVRHHDMQTRDGDQYQSREINDIFLRMP